MIKIITYHGISRQIQGQDSGSIQGGRIRNTRESHQSAACTFFNAQAVHIETSATFSPQHHKTHPAQYQTHKPQSNKKEESSAALKTSKVSPYHVFNPFYLDEL